MTHRTFLVISSLVLAFSISTYACVATVKTPIKVRPTFSVHVYNDFGPVIGLKLKIGMIESRDLLAEAITDEKGVATFQLHAPLLGGGLYVFPEHNVGLLYSAYAAVDVEADATTSSIELEWPSHVLRSRTLSGGIELMNHPFGHAKLNVLSAISYQEIASAVTNSRGQFRFAGIQPGLYFLQVNGDEKTDPRVPRGIIAVYVGHKETSSDLLIKTTYSDCGLSY